MHILNLDKINKIFKIKNMQKIEATSQFYLDLCDAYIKAIDDKADVKYLEHLSKMIFSIQERVDKNLLKKYKFDTMLQKIQFMYTYFVEWQKVKAEKKEDKLNQIKILIRDI